MTTPGGGMTREEARVLAWFSCGASSAIAAKVAMSMFPGRVVPVYCDTMQAEHPDNARFFRDVERWLGVDIVKLKSAKYASVEDVFQKTRYMSGPGGASCTVQMKKVPRFAFQRADDIHVFGFTADEEKRIARFEKNNPYMNLRWVLAERQITRATCHAMLISQGIALPAMYGLGYRNNNCLGCVKASSPAYWSKVKSDFPAVFAKRCAQSRDIGCRLVRVKGKRVFLDEMPNGRWGEDREEISCGPDCADAATRAKGVE